MDSWNKFLTDWEDLSRELKGDIYSTNSGYWSNKIVEILKDLFNDDNFDDAISFILKFYEIESNSEYIDKIINAKIERKGIVDFASEIQKSFLEYEEKLVELYDKILTMEFHPFFKFLYSNQEINNNLMKNESCIELLYSSMQGLTSMAKDLKAQEEFGKLYSNQWHFFFELLQNAVDADSEEVLVKRKLIENEWCLLIANKGKKFSPMDVWGIASIKQGMKSSKEIGYFGIGFKSVQEICDSPIIISTPFQFRLNFGQRKRENYVEWNLSEVYSKAFSLEQLRYNNYFIFDEIKKEEYSGFEDKVIEMLDPMFMMFLTPLKEILFSFEGLEDKQLKVKRKSYDNGFEIINIDDNKEKFIINRYSKKFNIENKEYEREVQIAFKINEKSKKIIIENKNSNLFSYFPLDNRNPGFNFVFHGQFSLTNSRQDINTAISLKKALNYKLFEELGPECFIELFRFLSSSKNTVLDEKLENLIPFEEKEEIIESDPKHLDIDINNSFRKGLIKLFKDPDNHCIPVWWDQRKNYIPFSNVIFTDDSSVNFNFKIINFLKIHFNSHFVAEIARILQNSSIIFDPDKDIYVCSDKFKIDFCKQVFENDFDERMFTSQKILDLIINILRSFEPKNNLDYILKDDWKNYYFNSEKDLEEFHEQLSKWHYFKENSTRARLFEHYLIILEDCNGISYYAKANFSNYYNIDFNFQVAYPEVFKVLKQLKSWVKKHSDYDLDLPLFIPEDYRESNSKFYSIDNLYSIFALNELLFTCIDSELNSLIFQEEDIYRSYFKIIENAIKRVEQKSSMYKRKFNLSELKKEYKLITQSEIFKRSDQEEEAFMIRKILLNFLELSIYKSISSNELRSFSELIWGNEEYLDLLSISPFSTLYIVIDYAFYYQFAKIQEFQENLVNLMRQNELFNREFFSKYILNWFSNTGITNALAILNKEHSDLILHKEPQDLIPILESFDTDNKILKILLAFFSSKDIFTSFSETFYSSISPVPETIIFLSNLTNPSIYQFFENKDEILTIEVIENLQPNEYILLKELHDILDERESNWVFKADLETLKKLGIKDISIKNSISQLLFRILDKLKNSDIYENWDKFYAFLQSYFFRLNEKEKLKFKKEIRRKSKDFKILNEEEEFVFSNLIYNAEEFYKRFNEFSHTIRKLIDLSIYESNRVHPDYQETWDFLKSSSLIPFPYNSMKKEFIKILLENLFQESIDENYFYNFLSDNFSEEEDDNHLELYRKFLNLIISVKLTLKDIKNFYIIPTMTMEFIKVIDTKQKYNILNNFDLEDFPREEILDKFEDFNWDYFDDWLNPGYFGAFKKIFNKDMEKKKAYNGKRFDEDIKKDDLPENFSLDETSPFFLHLYLIDYYFRLKEFSFEKDKEIISNSLKIFIKSNINDFLSKLKQIDFSDEDIQTIFSQALSGRKIFPVQQEGSDKIYLTDLDSEEITILSKKVKYPRVLTEISNEQKIIIYINDEIEKIIEKMPKEFTLPLESYIFPLEKILENCQEFFNPEIKENLKKSEHVQLIQYVFTFQNFNYYLENDRENLDQFLSSIELMTRSNVSSKISDIYNPKLVEKVEEGLRDLIGSNFKSEKLQSEYMLDVNLYSLKKKFLNITNGKEIFKDEISREEAYEVVYNYLNDNLQESENYKEIFKQIGGNLVTFDNKLEFSEDKPLEFLEDSIKEIIRFFIDKIRENKEIDFDKFFLDADQEIYKDLLSEDLIITIEHRDIDLLDNFAKYIEVEEDFKYSFFKDLMPFKDIKDYSFDILINKILEEDSKRIIKALNLLFENYSDSIEAQKETEEYRRIKEDIQWIQIDGDVYCLKSLFLKNSDLDISMNNLKSIMKGYAFFDDFDINDQLFNNFIEFFDIREITDENIIDHLEYLSNSTKNVRKNIRDLLIFLIEKDLLNDNVDRIEQIEFIEAIELNKDKSKIIISLKKLRDNYTFFSNKKLILDNLINEWSKAPEFQGAEIYLLFDKDVTWNPKWEIIAEEILIALNFEKLYGINEFPIPDSIEESDMNRVDNPYQQQTKILRAILEYLKINSKDGFPPLNLKEVQLNFLDKPINFYEIPNPKGDITIKTIDNCDFEINDVTLKKLFKLEEEDEVINVYISNDHRSSDRKKLYFREIFDKMFKNEVNYMKSYERFNEIVEWVWMDFDDLANCDSNPKIIKDYLIDKTVPLRLKADDRKIEKVRVSTPEISENLVQEQYEPQELESDTPKIEQKSKQPDFVEEIEKSQVVLSEEELDTKKDEKYEKTEPEFISPETTSTGTQSQDQNIVETPTVIQEGSFEYSDFRIEDEEEEVYPEEQDFDPICKPDEVSMTEISLENLDSNMQIKITGNYNYEDTEEFDGESNEPIKVNEEEINDVSSLDRESNQYEFSPESAASETPVVEMEYVSEIKISTGTTKRKKRITKPYYRPRKPPKDATKIGRWGEEYALSCLKKKKIEKYRIEKKTENKVVRDTKDGFVIEIDNKEVFEAVWVNKFKETHQGYDIYFKEAEEDFFIEVKATKTETIDVFDITPPEWSFLIENKEHYYIYRVYNAGKTTAKFLPIKNPYQLWKEGKIIAVASQIYI